MSKYTLYVLFGQRRCAYEGQYAPEALEVMDEFGWDENSQFLLDKQEEYRKTDEFTSLRIIRVELPFESIAASLNDVPVMKGEVKSP